MAKTQNERAVIDLVINGQQAQTSLKEVSTSITKMRSELNKMHEADDPVLYQKKLTEINKMIGAQREMTTRINNTTTAWGRFKKEAASVAGGIIGGNLVTTGLQMMIGLIPKAIEKTMALKDQLADISKATDMTDQEVGDLNKTLRGLNTRTATKELRDMAVVAGQFGIAKNEIAEFVESADMLNVALGDQFNGAEETAGTMLTLRNTFQDIKSERIDQDMLHIGNALNVLEADGAATASVMADFSGRIGGVAIPMGMTSGQVLGLSAALQEMNVTAERGGTAVVEILNGMAKAPLAFAKYARSVDGGKLTTKEFADLLNKDLYGALMAVVRGFNTGDTTATGMARKMDDMKLSGTGVMEIFMKLASNTQLVEDKITKAGAAIAQTDSITGEFNKKNHELAVNMKRLSEFFDGFFDSLSPMAEGIVSATVSLLGLNDAIGDSRKEMDRQRTAVADLEKNLLPLLTRYDKLKEKTTLSKDEQAELKKIVTQVSGVVPIATTEMDKYGNAIAISTDKARDFVKAQRELMKFKEKETLGEIEDELTKQRNRYAKLDIQIRGGITYDSSTGSGAAVSVRKLSNEEVKALQAQRKAVGSEIVKLKQARSAITGEGISIPGTPKVQPAQPTETGTTNEQQETEKEKTARERRERAAQRAADKKQKLAEKAEDNYETLITRARQRTAQIEGDSYEKQLLTAGTNYTKLTELAAGNKQKLAEIEELKCIELAAIESRENERKAKEVEKKKQETERQRKDEYDAALLALQLHHAEEHLLTAELEEAFTRTDEDRKMYRLEREERFLVAKLELAKKYGQETKQVQTEIAENQAEQGKVSEETSEDEQEQKAQEPWKIAEAYAGALDKSGQALEIYTKKGSAAWRAAIIAQKAAAIANAVISTQTEIRQIYANPALSTMPDTGIGVKTALAIAAGVRGAASIAIIAKQGANQIAEKAIGGYTDMQTMYGNPSGFVESPTLFNLGRRSYIAGEAGREFVINNQALQQPVVANFARILDGVQKSGNYASLTGGLAGGASGSNAFGIGSDSKEYVDVMSNTVGMAIVRELQANRAAMEDYANRPIMNNFMLFEQYASNIQEMRQSNTL